MKYNQNALLILCNEKDDFSTFQKNLRASGVEATCAYDEASTLCCLSEKNVDFILIDISDTHVDEDVALAMRLYQLLNQGLDIPRYPILAITTPENEPSCAAFLAQGIDGLILKPFNEKCAASAISSLNRALEGRRKILGGSNNYAN